VIKVGYNLIMNKFDFDREDNWFKKMFATFGALWVLGAALIAGFWGTVLYLLWRLVMHFTGG